MLAASPCVIEGVFGRDPCEVVGVVRFRRPGIDVRRQAETKDLLGVVQSTRVVSVVFRHGVILRAADPRALDRHDARISPLCWVCLERPFSPMPVPDTNKAGQQQTPPNLDGRLVKAGDELADVQGRRDRPDEDEATGSHPVSPTSTKTPWHPWLTSTDAWVLGGTFRSLPTLGMPNRRATCRVSAGLLPGQGRHERPDLSRVSLTSGFLPRAGGAVGGAGLRPRR